MSGHKYRSDVSWGDIEECIRDWYTEQGRGVEFHIKPEPGLKERAFLTVVSYEIASIAQGSTAYSTRHPFDPRQPTRLYSQLLRALFEHHSAYEADPWAWGPERRRRARGEA